MYGGGRTRFCFRIWESFAGSVSVLTNYTAGDGDRRSRFKMSGTLATMTIADRNRKCSPLRNEPPHVDPSSEAVLFLNSIYLKSSVISWGFFQDSLVNFSNAIEKR